MKNKNNLKLIGLFLIGLVILLGCNKDDDNLNLETNYLFDTWWYSSISEPTYFYFNSDGEFIQKTILFGIKTTDTGTWIWEDENSGIMKITVIEWDPFSHIWFKLSNIQENRIILQQSNDGTEYSGKFYFEKTNEQPE